MAGRKGQHRVGLVGRRQPLCVAGVRRRHKEPNELLGSFGSVVHAHSLTVLKLLMP